MTDLEFEHKTDYAPRQVGQIVASSRDNAWAIALGTSSKSDWRITKFFKGTTDGDATTLINHGVDFDQVYSLTAVVKSSDGHYGAYDYLLGTAEGYELDLTSTQIAISGVTAKFQSQLYKVTLVYYK